jgi:hypothetical protein
MHEALGAGILDQRLQRRQRRADQRAQRARLGVHLLLGARRARSATDRAGPRQIAPAQRQRPQRIAQPARHLLDDPRRRHRRHRRAVERAGIAERGALARRARDRRGRRCARRAADSSRRRPRPCRRRSPRPALRCPPPSRISAPFDRAQHGRPRRPRAMARRESPQRLSRRPPIPRGRRNGSPGRIADRLALPGPRAKRGSSAAHHG